MLCLLPQKEVMDGNIQWKSCSLLVVIIMCYFMRKLQLSLKHAIKERMDILSEIAMKSSLHLFIFSCLDMHDVKCKCHTLTDLPNVLERLGLIDSQFSDTASNERLPDHSLTSNTLGPGQKDPWPDEQCHIYHWFYGSICMGVWNTKSYCYEQQRKVHTVYNQLRTRQPVKVWDRYLLIIFHVSYMSLWGNHIYGITDPGNCFGQRWFWSESWRQIGEKKKRMDHSSKTITGK